MFNTAKALRLETDASDLAIGACLLQQHDGKWHPIAYHSRTLSPAEQNYNIHDKELLAIVASLEHWNVYAKGAPALDIYTDHQNLLTFTTTKKLNRRQVRWSELLGQYKFKVHYTPGKNNRRADALSRRHDYIQNKHETVRSILKENKNGTLSPRTAELNTILTILENEQEQYPEEKKLVHIL